jgi:predicted ArsR family transcriptional regulator
VSVRNGWPALSALVDRSRRALYEYVRGQDHAVSREEAADAAGISRTLAAFHLDKLVRAGLLRARYQSPPDQPRGRGRAPKVYEPARDELAVTIPPRRYELIAEILAAGIADDPTDAEAAARRRAEIHGRQLGARLAEEGADAVAALESLGFEPHADKRLVLLHNCPFHALATRHTALVCGINHAFLSGVLEGLGSEMTANLAPRPGFCCVELTA